VSIDFRRLGILLIDDSSFLRTLMVDCLKALRVGAVHIAEDGHKAIAMLERRAADPALALANPIDIIISNWQMKPGDGISFLHWVRHARATPDKFMPFLLFTAYTDTEQVEQARDRGADDVIAKPFSVKTVHDKIVSLVTREVIFVETAHYFGPDRRRQRVAHAGDNRRVRDEQHDDVECIECDAATAALLPPRTHAVRLYKLKNALAERVGLPAGYGAARREEEKKQIDAAQKVLDAFSEKYPAYAEDQVLELLSLRRSLAGNDFHEPLSAKSAEILDGIRSVTHDLVGQGGTFGFPLVTRAAKSLNRLAGQITRLDGRKTELIQTHIQLLQLILSERRAGANHPQVWDAIVGLEVAVQKCLA
jgi:two-component system, chemotaxis family, chemotaxis protein CheY